MKAFAGVPNHPRGEYALYPTDTVDAYFGDDTATRFVVPANAEFVVFASTGDFHALYGDNTVTAAVIAGDLSNGSASELNPGTRYVGDPSITHISIVATVGVNVTLAWFT